MARRLALSSLIGLLLCAAVPGRAADDRADDVRRLLALFAGIRTEYQEAFDATGRLARPIELEEARLLLAEGRDLNARLQLVPADQLAAIDRGLDGSIAADVMADRVDGAMQAVTTATGLRHQPLPPQPPSVARGKAIFDENCVTCHGSDGAGGGEEATRLGLTPADFTDRRFMSIETPEDFFNMISLGRRRSGMPEWEQSLSVQQRWDAVAYIWSLSRTPSDVTTGEQVFATSCAGCHDAQAGAGAAPLSAAGSLVGRSDAALLTFVSEGDATTHRFGTTLGADACRQVVTFVRARALGGMAGADEVVPESAGAVATASDERVRTAIADAHRLLDEALAAHRGADAARAGPLATDAYMRFEPVERRLGARDPGLVAHVEEGFVRFRTALRTGAPAAELDALAASVHRDLDASLEQATMQSGGWPLFLQSAAIILREGFEVVLLVGALLTFVRRSGQVTLVRPIWLGSALGLVASVLTAVLLVTMFRLTPGLAEVLEGAAMLVAAVVLFWVSYWLVSKAEADRWQRYIRGKVERAIAGGSAMALGAAAFLAVYREGFETVLFYQALAGSAPAGDVGVPAGFVTGVVVLGIVSLLLRRLGLRIPMGPFFLVTGGLLYAMAVIFAGRGIFELQEVGTVSITPVPWAPRIPVLGVFPTVESLAAQGVFVALLLYAVVVTLRRRSQMRQDPVPTEAPRVA